jgi:hypothetical protein
LPPFEVVTLPVDPFAVVWCWEYAVLPFLEYSELP